MKKALSIMLALAMVVGFGSFTAVGAAAKTTEDGQRGALYLNDAGNFKVNAMLKSEEKSAAEAPKEVLVQFAETEAPDVSQAEAKTIEKVQMMAAEDHAAKGSKEIKIADGITVNSDEVWEFSSDDGTDPVIIAVASSDKLSTEKMIRKLESRDIITAVSPNYKRHICSDGDTYRDYQWAIDPYPGLDAEAEWEDGNTGSEENIVAVIDTGIYYNHEDLQGQIWNNPFGSKLKGEHGFDFANGDTNPEDDNGHGTHCAGIIGAATNGDGVQGVNQKVSLMALKVLDEAGDGWDSDIIAGFNYIYKAMDLGANVVAINCSFGGEEEDPIMEEVIDKLGKKGAVTVCAAGNEAMNNDEEPSYPACCDSPYVISVAATKSVPDGENPDQSKPELVSFSNYGEDSVDIAAPGTDILSTVSYDCFNPTLYGDNTDIVQTYLDGSDVSALTEPEDPNLTNMSAADIEASAQAGFFSGEGIKIRFDNSKITPEDGQPSWQYAAIPYDLPEGFDEEKELGDVAHSLMIRTLDGPQGLTLEQYFAGTFSKVLLMDVPRKWLDPNTDEGKEFFQNSGVDLLMEHVHDYQMVSGDDDYWTHLRINMLDSIDNGKMEAFSEGTDQIDPERALLIVGSTEAGAFTAYIDDIGTSQYTKDTSVFGQYDFYSGTSMATPYVAGAAALARASIQEKDYEPEMLIGEIMSMANDTNPLKAGKKRAVNTEGVVDFAKKRAGFWVGISSVTVDTAKKQITLKGRFDDGNVELKIKKDGAEEAETVPESAFVSRTAKEIILKDNGWINNVFDITVSKSKDGKTKTSTKKDVYAVKGKKNYATFAESASEIMPESALTTNGKLIYAAQSVGDSILYMNPGNKYFEADEIAVFSKSFIKKNFTMAKNMSKTAAYDFRFGDDLVKIGNTFYVKGAFCEVAGSGDGEEEDWSDGKVSASAAQVSGGGGSITDSNGAAYAEESYVFKINASTGKITKMAWPKNAKADMLTDSKLASYNGSLYLLGGINESDNSFSTKVYSYNAAKNTWTAKAGLPQGRAGGKVLQSGNKLIYTLGYTADSAQSGSTPANFVFNGSKWVKKSAKLEPIDAARTMVSRGEQEYCDVSGSVGICRNGLVYMGVPVKDYGDTFTYNADKDTYTATGFNYTKDLDDVYGLYSAEKEFGGLAVGNRIVGIDDDMNITGVNKAIQSGLLTVKTSIKNGTMTGKGTYMPGTGCTVKATARPGYYVKSLNFAGKSGKARAKGMYVSALVTKDVTASAKTARVKVRSVKSLMLKRGKSASLKAKITPATAAKQWKLAYKSSNTKYATVTAKGVVKASKKKAAKGKTVKIMIRLKGTNKTMKTVTVKIK